MGEKSSVVGSSKGDQFEVKWMEITIRKHYKFDGTLDVMKPCRLLLDNVELNPVREESFALAAEDKARITAALDVHTPCE